MKKKELYIKPEIVVIDVEMESAVLTVSEPETLENGGMEVFGTEWNEWQ